MKVLVSGAHGCDLVPWLKQAGQQVISPCCEDDMVTPINVYGRSKWEEEHCLLKHLLEAAVIHTSWFYRSNGHNFAKTIFRLALEKESLQVVDDQMGSPE